MFLNKKIISGNWKMNKVPEEAGNFIQEINKLENFNILNREIIIFAPYIDLPVLLEKNFKNKINIGAQNCFYEKSGAFTGEISVEMLKKININYILIGHSERRNIFLENNEIINKKVKACLNLSLKPVICIGENLEEKKLEITNEIISIQVKTCLKNINKEDFKNIVIAYEPIWSIGTGKTADIQEIDKICKRIKLIIQEKFKDNNINISVLYGGSVSPENSKVILNQENIDGVLVGGASLDLKSLLKIINN